MEMADFAVYPQIFFSEEYLNVVVDNDGNLHVTETNPATLNCSQENFIPKIGNNNNLLCSMIQDDGNTVGINGIQNTFSGTPLVFYVNGNQQITGSSFITSDERFKSNITTLDNNIIDKLFKIRPVKYKFKNSVNLKEYNFPQGENIGVIAQEVEKVFPELVLTSDQGTKSVNYDGFIPLLLKAIQLQQEQIFELQNTAALGNSQNNQSGNSGILNKLEIYPNPSNGIINIIADIRNEFNIIITDLQGKTVKSIKGNISSDDQIIEALF